MHYEIRIKGQPVNPTSLKTIKAPSLPADQRLKFEHIVQQRLLQVEDQLISKNKQTDESISQLR